MSEPVSTTPPPSKPSPRRPWPLKWIVLAILIYALFQMFYLFLTTR